MNFLKSAYGKVSLMLILLLTALLSLYVGSAGLSAGEFFGGFIRTEGLETESIIIYSLRLPRVLGAITAGAGLSLSGLLLQSVTGNDLASPNIIGVNSGAGMGVILMLALFPSAVYAVPVTAFFGAFLTTLFIVGFSFKTGMRKNSVILVGVAVTALLNSGISFLSYRDTDLLASYNYFSVGGLSGVKTEDLTVPFIFVSVSIIISMLFSRETDTLMLGDSIALSLGTDVKKHRVLCLILSSACAGAVVSFAGLLGFVGLVVPHIARRMVGGRMKDLIPVSVLSGGILMLLADLVGRTAVLPSEIPVGIVMSFIGAPFFFYLLIRRGKNA